MHWTTSFPRCRNARAAPPGLSTRFLDPGGRRAEHSGYEGTMTSHRYPGLRRYALSVLTIGGAVLLSWPLHPLQDIAMPLLVLAVLISAWYGGPGPALFSAVLAVLAADYFFIEPVYSIDLNLAFVERTLTFGLILGVVIWFAHIRKRAEEKLLEQSERLQDQTRVLEAAKEDLKRADRMKDEFLAVLSHELRNPLG